MAMNVNNEHCCEIKQHCDHDPSKCPISKRNKEIAEFEKAKERFEDGIKEELNFLQENGRRFFCFIKKKLSDYRKKMKN